MKRFAIFLFCFFFCASGLRGKEYLSTWASSNELLFKGEDKSPFQHPFSFLVSFLHHYNGILKRNDAMKINFPTTSCLWLPISMMYYSGIFFFLTLMRWNNETGCYLKHLTSDRRLRFFEFNRSSIAQGLSFFFLGGAFLLHSYLFLLKNTVFYPLFDTGICAAWLAVLFGFLVWMLFKHKHLFIATIFAAASCFTVLSIWGTQTAPTLPVFCINGKFLTFLHDLLKALGFTFLFFTTLMAQTIFILRKTFIHFVYPVILQWSLYGGTFCMGVSLLMGALGASSEGMRIFEWNSPEWWALLIFSFYTTWIYFSYHKGDGNILFALWTGLGLIALKEGWKNNFIFSDPSWKKTLDGFLLLFEMVFFTIVFIQRIVIPIARNHFLFQRVKAPIQVQYRDEHINKDSISK